MDAEQAPLLAPTAESLAQLKVFPLISAIRKSVTNDLAYTLSWDRLIAEDVDFTLIQPLVRTYAAHGNISVVYACLVVRQYFLTEADAEIAFAPLMISRASLCEILAIKLLGFFSGQYLRLVAALTTSWSPLQGAPKRVVNDVRRNMNAHDEDLHTAQGSAIDMAISTEAKDFLASPLVQKVVNDIYSGKIVLVAAANRSIIADNYKAGGVEIYNHKKASFLDHYRLRVPKYDSYLEFINFAILLMTFMLCLSTQDKSVITFPEAMFMLFAAAFTLEEYTASTGHGWIIYIANIWNAFDFGFIVIFLAYLALRLKGLSNDDLETSAMAFDVLACGACILFPRLAFFFVSDNLVILSLRAMISQFIFFITIAAICFSGLLFTLWTLSADISGGKTWTVSSIAWLMVQIWFGNTSLSFDQASSFHPLFGPVLMTAFAALSNTLLLTILISMLSNTVARIDANAQKESLFQYTVSTVEGVKSDALYVYQPPFNILAFLILKPLSWFLSARSLHTANVFLIRLTSLPQLVVIAIYERYFADGRKLRRTSQDAAQSLYNSLPRHVKNMPLFEALIGNTSNDLFEAIFEVEHEGEVDHGLVNGNGNGMGNGYGGHGGDRKHRRRSRSRGSKRSALSTSSSPARPQEQERKRPSSIKIKLDVEEEEEEVPPAPTSEAAGSSLPAAPIFSTSTVESPESTGRSRRWSTLSPLDVTSIPSARSAKSPLARILSGYWPQAEPFPSTENGNEVPNSGSVALNEATEKSMKRIEAMLDEAKALPVHNLRKELKDLQDQQARIENLLLMLTRGMRNELGHGSRQGTVN